MAEKLKNPVICIELEVTEEMCPGKDGSHPLVRGKPGERHSLWRRHLRENPQVMARKKPVAHNPRTKKLLLSEGALAIGNAETWNPFSNTKRDLFGFIDLVALIPGGIFGIQVTSRANHAARRKKILANVDAENWLKAKGRILIISWVKKKNRWQAKQEEVYIYDFGHSESAEP